MRQPQYSGLTKTLTRTAALVALSAAVIIPAVYVFTAYIYESERIQGKAEFSADTISEIIYLNPRMWRFETHRIEAMYSQMFRENRLVQMRVIDPQGELVVDVGDPPATPRVSKLASLADGLADIGSVEITESVRHVWQRSVLVSMFGIALAAAIFIALRVLPMRALLHALGRLDRSQNSLRAAQRELEGLNRELEERVKERTEELRAAQEELLRNERLTALGELTATVAHELRNPLGTIRTSSFTVSTKTRDKGLGVERALDRITRNISRCDRIIGELLDFSRKRPLELQSVDLDRWLESVLQEQAVPDGVRVRSESGSSLEVELDLDRMRRVIINVYDNACDAMQESMKTKTHDHVLTVRTQHRDDRLEIVFIDTGIGMSEEVRARIFESLYSTKGFGVGLGLQIALQIMQQHGGGMEVESTEGEGTRTLLWLPLPEVACE